MLKELTESSLWKKLFDRGITKDRKETTFEELKSNSNETKRLAPNEPGNMRLYYVE